MFVSIFGLQVVGPKLKCPFVLWAYLVSSVFRGLNKQKKHCSGSIIVGIMPVGRAREQKS